MMEGAILVLVGMLSMAFLGGFIFLVARFAIAFNRLIGAIGSMAESAKKVDESMKTLLPFLNGEQFVRFSNAVVQMGKQGAAMLHRMERLNEAITLFYNFTISLPANAATAEATGATNPLASGRGKFGGPPRDEAAASVEEAEAAGRAKEEFTG